jgi:hypothetical protein
LAIQEWTIIKLVGPAAGDAAARFERWRRARRSDDPSCFTAGDWPASVRRDAAGYVSRLLDHRLEMPVAYFSQHVDLWLAGGAIGRHLVDAERFVWHDAGQLWCYRLPDRGRLVRRNAAAAARAAQFPESELLARRLIEAAQAYDELWADAVVLVNRHAVAGSPSDDELTAAAAKLPKWLGRRPATARPPANAADRAGG